MKFQFSLLFCSLILSCAVVTSNAWPSPDYEEFKEENEDLMDTQEEEESVDELLAKIMYDGMLDAEESDYEDGNNDDDSQDDDSLIALVNQLYPSGRAVIQDKMCSSKLLKYKLGCHLKIKVLQAKKLPNKDFLFYNKKSDPYVVITAYPDVDHSQSTSTVVKRTKVDKDDLSPKWNQVLDFGVNTWRSIDVQVFDADKKVVNIFKNKDDKLSSKKRYDLADIIGEGEIDMNTYGGGHLYFLVVNQQLLDLEVNLTFSLV